MKFLFASDSFKGSLSSQKTAELLAKAAREIFPDCQCDSIVVADGGEGTTAAVLAATNGKKLPVQVHGPLWEDITSPYGMPGYIHSHRRLCYKRWWNRLYTRSGWKIFR